MTVDELERYGMERMDGDAIASFLASHSLGVLGLPTDGVPYLLPLSYAADDGGERLYFSYLVGDESRKASLTDRAREGAFLVYDVETMFRWRSVALAGDLSPVPEAEWDDVEALTTNAWRPSVLQSAVTGGGVELYEFAVRERTGIEQRGLAPGFRENVSP